MFDIFLAYISDLVNFGSVDLVGTFGKFFDTLSADPGI
jgi:hypothetical protein